MNSDVIIIGGGIAGIITAIELLDHNKKVILLDRDQESYFGGQAKESFGGICLIDSPLQKKAGIRDNAELALSDWCSFAEFGAEDELPKSWAKKYIERSIEDVYLGLKKFGVKFFPVVHWVERGLYCPGNSVPRFHMVWGTGKGLIDRLVYALLNHPRRENLKLLFQHDVEHLIEDDGRIVGCSGKNNNDKTEFSANGDFVVLACGGIGANLDLVKKHWHKDWTSPPEKILIGCHRYADGKLHEEVKRHGGNITHLDKMWNYAAGIQHPNKDKPFGLSLVPPKSALWMDFQGRRIGPVPLVTAYDTRFLVTEVCKRPKKYSWHILNWKIAEKELAVSGSEFNQAIRDKKLFSFLKTVIFGNKKLVKQLTSGSEDFVVAENLPELVKKMNELNGDQEVKLELLEKDIKQYDLCIDRGVKFHNDDQLRRITHLRQYPGDRLRTCKHQKILDPQALPLIAIRLHILARKSLGGMQTDLDSKVLRSDSSQIPGLYAVGEAAGFGGGGIHGLRALEGTFLGSCLVTGKAAAQSIVKS